ncbi:MAG: ATP-grasp domain-containing protein [Acidimicrobiales bacterium]
MKDSPLIALATAAEVAELDEEGQLLASALRERGAQVTPAVWDGADIDWAAYDLVVVRSTWDYAMRRPAYLAWAEQVATVSRLLNAPDLLTWNTDKRYLHDLAHAGVSIVPSQFIDPGECVEHDWLHTEHVVKPSVSAGSKDTLRLGPEDADRSVAHLSAILDTGRTALVQPYLADVDTAGETAMLFCDAEFSHAMCKGAILERGAGLVEGLFAPEVITPRTPSDAEMALGRAAMAAIPGDEPPLYARIDALPSPDGPVVLEIELTEPSMFFEYADGSAGRFADAILARLG